MSSLTFKKKKNPKPKCLNEKKKLLKYSTFKCILNLSFSSVFYNIQLLLLLQIGGFETTNIIYYISISNTNYLQYSTKKLFYFFYSNSLFYNNLLQKKASQHKEEKKKQKNISNNSMWKLQNVPIKLQYQNRITSFSVMLMSIKRDIFASKNI